VDAAGLFGRISICIFLHVFSIEQSFTLVYAGGRTLDLLKIARSDCVFQHIRQTPAAYIRRVLELPRWSPAQTFRDW